MDLSKVLERVRKLVAMAEAPIAPGATPEEAAATKLEQDKARAMADELMEKYAIEEWQAMQAAGPSGAKPSSVRIDIGAGNSPFLQKTALLAQIVADYCRCSAVWMRGSGWGSEHRQEQVKVYGYEGDLRYFELLFTTLYLHMAGAIFPAPDPSLSIEDNAYALHNAGLNWAEIAEVYGWRGPVDALPGEPKIMYVHRESGERASWSKAVAQFKNAYRRAIKARGEEALRIPPSGSDNFRQNAAEGYVNRIYIRLMEQAGRRSASTALVLKDRENNIADMIAAEHPDLEKLKARKLRYNPEAYGRGDRHARTASLNPEAGKGHAPAIGG